MHQQSPYVPGQVTQADFITVLRQWHAQVQEQARLNAQVAAELKALLEETRKATQQQVKEGAIPRFIEDIPGKRVPYTWVITVDYDSAISNGTVKSGSATLSQDGPFVAATYKCFWQVTTITSGADADIQRVFLPPGRMPWFMTANTVTLAPPRDQIDLLLTLQLSGGDRLWQNRSIPAISFYDTHRPYYLPMPGLIERNETLTIECTAQVSDTAGSAPDSGARGTVFFVVDGYKILRPLDYAESQGWMR